MFGQSQSYFIFFLLLQLEATSGRSYLKLKSDLFSYNHTNLHLIIIYRHLICSTRTSNNKNTLISQFNKFTTRVLPWLLFSYKVPRRKLSGNLHNCS